MVPARSCASIQHYFASHVCLPHHWEGILQWTLALLTTTRTIPSAILSYLKSPKAQDDVKNALKLSDVNPDEFDALVLPGGHAPMFDLAKDETLAHLVSSIYEKEGVVAGICYGPVRLLNAKLSDGQYLVKGKHMTSFPMKKRRIWDSPRKCRSFSRIAL